MPAMTPSPSSQPKCPPVCSGCGNRPALGNDPCAVCGRSSQEEARELTDEQIVEWRRLFDKRFMTSAIDEYSPEEFGLLLDEVQRLRAVRPTPDLGDVDELVEALGNIARAMPYGPDQAWIEQAADKLIALRAALGKKD